MSNREACELYIEQEIKDSLAAGKKPWTIGKELSKWVEKLFEVTINPKTLAKRADRIKSNSTNVENKSQPTETTTNFTPLIIENRQPQGGGAREGAGRPPKLIPPSHALEFAAMAISQLDRIQPGDPQKDEALNQVIEYCQARKENE